VSRLRLIGTSTPVAPASGKVELYVASSDKKLRTIDSTGLVRVLAAVGEGNFFLKQIDVLTNTALTTYSVPSDARALYVECIGGGGAGGASAASGATTVALGGGGGGGAYSAKLLTSNLNPGSTLAVVVGAGAPLSGGAGSAGTDTSFKDSTGTIVCLAKGGGGGGAGSPAATPPIIMGVAGVGGAASSGTGDYKLDGGAGGWGWAFTTGNGLTGSGGGSPGGAMVNPTGGGINIAGTTGKNYGGGGVGGGAAAGSGSTSGGAGAGGMIRVTVFT